LVERGRRIAVGAGEVPLEARALTGAGQDGTLVASCRSGDAAAFARLVQLHEGMVVNLSARLLGDSEEARDVAQEVFLQVYRMLGRFEARSALKTWIYRIAVNQCHNRRRWWKRRRRERLVSLELLAPSDEARLAAAGGPEQDYERSERARDVQRALQTLPFAHRTVLLLREVEGLSCEEVSGALGVPVGTVKSRLSRARETLRRELERRP
jgi:RNA polymerase sigma-70 factor (ECF subfamily)